MTSQILGVLLTLSMISFSAEARRDQKREARQQARIHEGVKTGELNKAEAHRLRKGQRRVDKAQMAAKSDGVVTDQEKAKLEKMQDVQSKRIYDQKHDEQTRPETPAEPSNP
jgi:hypothetical protein